LESSSVGSSPGGEAELDELEARDIVSDLIDADISGFHPSSSESTQNLRPKELLTLRKTVEAKHGPRLVLTTDRAEVTHPLERRETVLGKAKECHVALPALGWGGGRAARIVLHPEGRVELFKESRLCEVRVNNKKVKNVDLNHGDTIRIGSYKILYLAAL